MQLFDHRRPSHFAVNEAALMTQRQGHHFLQIPGPSPVPERVLRAMDRQVIDHRGPEFQRLGLAVLEGCKAIFKTSGPVVIYPSSGTGAWEAAIVNTLSPGDKVLMVETGHFATLWRQMAARWGIEVDFIPGDWRHGVDPALIEAKLAHGGRHALRRTMKSASSRRRSARSSKILRARCASMRSCSAISPARSPIAFHRSECSPDPQSSRPSACLR